MTAMEWAIFLFLAWPPAAFLIVAFWVTRRPVDPTTIRRRTR